MIDFLPEKRFQIYLFCTPGAVLFYFECLPQNIFMQDRFIKPDQCVSFCLEYELAVTVFLPDEPVQYGVSPRVFKKNQVSSSQRSQRDLSYGENLPSLK